MFVIRCVSFQNIYGEDQDDIIYGGNNITTEQNLFGDFKDTISPELGGNDKIIGGNNIDGT